MCLHCPRPACRGPLCNLHDHRKRDGRPMDDPIRQHRGFRSATVSYQSAHSRVKRLWGSASQYTCVNCGEPARDWAYDHTDPTELLGESKRNGAVLYSVWEEFYKPMCGPCHGAFDHPGPVTENPAW